MPRPDLSVDLAPRHPRGLRLANPVMLSSGLWGYDGYGGGLPEGLDYSPLGAVVAKTTTLRPREGYPKPQVFQTEHWVLNAVGLRNPGISAVLREKAPLWAGWRLPVVLSIAGETVEEFARLARMADGAPGISALEVNASCPNVAGGLEFAQSPELAAKVTRAVKAATALPVWVKLTPNVTDIVKVARAAASAGADALVLVNTLVGLSLDVEGRRPRLSAGLGGVSGPALKPVALAAVYRVAGAVGVPVIGVGGIATAEDALEFILAGATAVQVGSAVMRDLRAPLLVLEGLQRYLEERGIPSIRSLIGAGRPQAP